MEFTYKTKGVCSVSINIDVDGDTVKSVKYLGGCHGNLQGICALVEGMKVDAVIERLENIRCGFKNTSCPAQLADALKKYKAENL
ncbi:MAG: TIGR03905 family TSCPD domain-containing protein [Clostridia bacterium]|nr:TIGR03905 family TSCPD domain-containing protein [Clostridia bacterium]